MKPIKEAPFFLYYATPLPHVPLQVPQKYVDKYVEKFGDEEPYLGEEGYFPNRYPKAAYAAMVTYLDDQVGEIISKLKETGQYENTLIIFSSDNGPTYNGGTNSTFFDSAKPFKSEYGWGKGFVHEGGIRVPMIAVWENKIESGTTSDLVSAFWDVMPTLAEVAGAKLPENIDGISFLPERLGHEGQHEHEFLYWEFPAYEGQQAVRMGKWKGIRQNIFKGNIEIELYDLKTDPLELHDVAKDHADIVAEIQNIMKKSHQRATIDRFKIPQLGDT